ncbi:MAG TPA: 50S ribosomal protein L20 [bacterium]|nr:50S ribosomal protein L20 [bacterium]HQN72963.1 50S ribosomal protein L20 [bacterium]HQO92073.1 50S ribosomal protein L20 [bacterium]
MRVKRGFKAKRRRATIMKAAKGNYQSRSKTYRVAKETVERGWSYAFAHRKLKKRDFRKLWITRINAAVRERGLTYSTFIDMLNKANIDIDRKVLAFLAVEDPGAFDKVIEEARAVN